jgi:hypothetical protein
LIGLAAKYRWGWNVRAIADAMSLDEFNDWCAFAHMQNEADEDAVEAAKQGIR